MTAVPEPSDALVTVTRCEKSWLDVRFCAHCLGHNAEPPDLGIVSKHWGVVEPNLDDLRVYAASTPTACDECGRTIRVGEMVARFTSQDHTMCEGCLL